MSDPFYQLFQEMDAHFHTLSAIESFEKDSRNIRRKFSVGNRYREVYHYTSIAKLESILNHNELWFTHRDFVNDVFERSYSRTLVESVLEDSHISPLTKTYMQKIGSGSQYIFCLSLEKDLANHWLSYSSTDGYCLIFNRKKLSQFLKDQGFKLAGNGKIVYETETPSELLKMAISYLEKLEPYENMESAQPKIRSLLASINYYGCLSKKDNYRCEFEYRYIVFDMENTLSKKVRVLNGIAVPYIAVGGVGGPKLPIEGIIVGPRINDDVAKVGLIDLFNSHGYNFNTANILESGIRIR